MRVAVERGVDRGGGVGGGGLTYGLREELADVSVGERVRVPLGRGNAGAEGLVVERMAEPGMAVGKVKGVMGRAREQGVALPGDLVELGKWIAGYYVCPLGMVYGAMRPAAVRRGTGSVERRVVRLATVENGSRGAVAEGRKLTALQGAVVGAVEQLGKRLGKRWGGGAHAGTAWASGDGEGEGGGWVEEREVMEAAGAKTVGPVRRLVELGVLEGGTREEVTARGIDVGGLEAGSSEAVAPARLEVTREQAKALDHLCGPEGLGSGFGVHLLHGVTGSGKTEVYLRLIEAMRERERSEAGETGALGGRLGVIVLVPEIALTPQTVGRFVGRLDRVAVLHSGLTAAQRHVEWRRVAAGEADVVVGARSAVFAPLARVGLIIVDEEHDSSYKQDQLPRYHARDVAIKRAQLSGAMVVLGSATPSMESYARAGGRTLGAKRDESDGPARARASRGPGAGYHYLSMPSRVAGAVLPEVEVVDLIEERRERRGVHLLSRVLERRLQDTVDAGGQAMLLLNRRGYANYLACPALSCGWQLACDHCDATMVYHLDAVGRGAGGGRGGRGLVRCHHCEAERVLPERCPVCSRNVAVFGLGTQRVEEELAGKFPGLRLARMDSDTMRRAEDYRNVLGRFGAGEIDVLLGTQMIAKGLDYPNVRLVGVVSADTALNLPDFRASERTFQLVAQVAGRAGRAEHPGRVVVQTFSPQDPAIKAASEHDYQGFAARELAIRERSGLPPSTRMTRVVCRDLDQMKALKHATQTAVLLQKVNRDLALNAKIRDPAACPLSRIADHHRVQVEVITSTAAVMQRLLTEARNRGGLVSDAKTAVDVDPVALL